MILNSNIFTFIHNKIWSMNTVECCYKLPVFYDTPDEKMYLFNEFRDDMKKTFSKLV